MESFGPDGALGERKNRHWLTLKCLAWAIFAFWQVGSGLVLWKFSAFVHMSTQDAAFFDQAGRQRLLAQQTVIYLQMVKEGHREDRARLVNHAGIFEQGLLALERADKEHRGAETAGRGEPEAVLAAARSFWNDYRVRLEYVARLPRSDGRFSGAYAEAVALAPRLVEVGDAYVKAEVRADHAETQRMNRFLTILAVLNLIVPSLGLWAFHRWFFHPMEDLQTVIAQFRDGDYAVRASLPGYGEMRTLIEAFNAMTRSVDRNSAQLRDILDNSPAVVFIKDPEGRYLFVNRRYETLFHQTRRDIVGKTDFDVFPKEAAEKFRAADREVLRRGESLSFEEEVPQDEGPRHYLSAKFPLRDSLGAIYGVCGIAADISDMRRAQAENARLVSAVEQSTDAIFMTDPDGKILFVNAGFERMTGFSRQEVIGANPRILKSGKMSAEHYRALWQTIKSGKPLAVRVVNRRKDGALFDVEQVVSPMKDAAGKVTGFVSVLRDITRSLQLEEELRQSQKMDAIGRLAGGVAHDFNNILTSILGYCSLLKHQIESGPARADLDEITAAGERAAALTHQLLAFSRKQPLSPKVLDLNAAVGGMERMLKRIIGENVALICRLSPEPVMVKADQSQLEQVILNLAVNARDAMPKGGSLTIATDNLPDRRARLTVTDTGTGMDEKIQKRIFEPFFTTKGLGRGTGMGLATVYGIVVQSGGAINVRSALGQGTSFEVDLPVVTDELETAKKGSAPAPAPAGGGKVILLVEDEEPLRRLTARLLSEGGYAVIEAADAESALDLFRERRSEVRLLLTDVVLPKSNGRWLAGKLRELKPDLEVLYLSGYQNEVIAHGEVIDPGLHFLPKPFTTDGLLSAVSRAFDA